MFVVADIEWIKSKKGNSPTQLAAVRVDSDWAILDSFETFFRPRDDEKHNWKHIAYTGGTSIEFLHAPNIHNALASFMNWLEKDDIILWWHLESRTVFKQLIKRILKTPVNRRMIAVNEYLYTLLEGQEAAYGSAYFMASARGIFTNPDLEHYAMNDVRVICNLMTTIGYQQSELLKPVVKRRIDEEKHLTELPFQYDPETKKIHYRECPNIEGKKTHGYSTWKSVLKKGYQPCDCCRKEYYLALKEQNKDSLERSEFTYVYTPKSKVFHKYTCSSILLAKKIRGSVNYDTVVATGRIPCKHCNPSPNDRPNPISLQSKAMLKNEDGLTKTVKKALSRQESALEERYRIIKDATLGESEKADAIILTQPHLAFWVGQGYQTFHLKHCPKLQQVSNLRGFRTYQEAIRAGYTPCKKCKPTAKHDAVLSVPITNRVRAQDNIEDLIAMCKDAAYGYYVQDGCFLIETPVGKWRIHLGISPIPVDHINLVTTPSGTKYHQQHRIFLSLIDTFDYIKRHDDELIEEKNQGKSFARYAIQK